MKTAQAKRSESGGAIMVAIFTTALMAAFVGLAVDYSTNIGRNAQRDRVFNNAVEIGDGCLELAFGAWRKLSATVEAPPTTTFDGIPQPSLSYFPSFPEAVISNFRVQAVDPMVTLSSNNPPISALATTSAPPRTTGPGDGTYSYFYLATVDVRLPVMQGALTAKVRRIFEKRYTSAWNWAMLYNENLELHPNSKLTLNGWVHANENLYVGNPGDTPAPTPPPVEDPNNPPPPPPPPPTPTPNLYLTDRMTYAGNYTVGYDPVLGITPPPVMAEPVTPADLPPGTEQVYYPFGWKPSMFNTTDNNGNNDGFREMIEKPVNGQDALSKERLYNQANIAIEIDGSNTVRVYTGTGANKNLASSSGSSSSLPSTAYNAAGNAVKPGYYLQDNRQGANVRTVNFDVSEFIKYFPNYNTRGWNGIVYITDTSGSSNSRAIRVVNGAKVPTGGITIVSDNPVYVQGDFNTGRTSTSEPPSNTGNPEDPEAGTYVRQPSSIMADAITLLSNNWQDGNASKSVAERPASNTTVNAALVAGNVPTTSGYYSGGGENFVRFLEDWTNKTFTYYGSMMGMYASKQATGTWGKANVYGPATLQWYFDRKLSVDDSGNPVSVPGYVSTVAYLQQQRWYLQY
ncbi:MAG TPA: hypothetical protein VG095_00825 [Chthoniobacterales bacterium]|nr:hypothetical protein [Chthoniobacterales bacterium]